MQNHNEEKQNFWMMAGMMIFCCFLPFLIIAFLGVTGNTIGFSSWLIIPVMVIFLAIHFLIMKKMHNLKDNSQKNTYKKNNKNNNKQHSDGCH